MSIRALTLGMPVAAAALALLACGGSGSGDDPCAGVACSGQGDCLVVAGEPVCDCNSGFHRNALACDPDPCRPTDCVHGHCLDAATSPDCACEPGYSGGACDDCADGYRRDGLDCVLAGPCTDQTCNGHGTCRSDGASATCRCSDGWGGARCDACDTGYHDDGGACVPDSPCLPDPCVHSTHCDEVSGHAVCTCVAGYGGDRCADCAEGFVASGLECVPGPGPCDPNPCPALHPDAHKDRCVPDAGSATCLCSPGYQDDAGTCVVQTVCVAGTTCSGHGTCTGAGLECRCDDGYDGTNCAACADGYRLDGTACVPKDPTDPCTPNPCGDEPDRRTCVTVGGVAQCRCDAGHDEVSGVCVAACDVDASACAKAHASFGWIVSANGHGALVVNLDPSQLPAGADQSNYRYMLTVHPYQTWGVNAGGAAINTRDVLYDTYMGVRVDGVGTWLDGIPRDHAGYYGQDGIPHWVQTVSGLRVETFAYAPWQLSRPAAVLLTRVTNTGTASRQVSIYSLQNYHVGNTQDDSAKFPDTSNESVARDADTGAFIEQAAGGAVVHFPLGAVAHSTAAAAGSAADPFIRLNAGADLGDEPGVAAGDDRVCGFQAPTVDLAPGATAWFGVVSAFDAWKDTATLLADVRAAYGGKDAPAALKAARAEWTAWRKPMPAGLTPAEASVYRTSEAVLRMGQVWEPTDKSKGQILASLPPGMWATSWPRDMSYSIAALARMGHFAEARAALEFMLLADSDGYRTFPFNGGTQTGVGEDYRVSVCRYQGRGLEESDWNADGPNVEFDGFGLFLWALGEYVRASGDATLADTYWADVQGRIANVLVGLKAANGMIAPDSSIWEVHWNGRQKQYAYTSLAAANGLCQASQIATARQDALDATAWSGAAAAIVAAVRAHAVDGSHFLAQSVEELAGNSGYVDAAVVEAFNWNLLDPAGDIAKATLDRLSSDLAVPNGMGLSRNDDGGWYDRSEWVLIDLRTADALRRSGDAASVATANRRLDWITAQGLANLGLIAELHDRDAADYAGAVPMVGFGAGAYVLERWLKAEPTTPQASCGIAW